MDPTGAFSCGPFEDLCKPISKGWQGVEEALRGAEKYSIDKFDKAVECGRLLGGSGTGDCDPLDLVFPSGVEPAY